MASFVVTYPPKDGARFDADYYVATHMPLVRDKWTQYGLVSATALMPDGPNPAFLAVALLEFANAAARERCLGSPEAADVFGDVPNFTDIAPVALACSAK